MYTARTLARQVALLFVVAAIGGLATATLTQRLHAADVARQERHARAQELARQRATKVVASTQRFEVVRACDGDTAVYVLLARGHYSDQFGAGLQVVSGGCAEAR